MKLSKVDKWLKLNNEDRLPAKSAKPPNFQPTIVFVYNTAISNLQLQHIFSIAHSSDYYHTEISRSWHFTNIVNANRIKLTKAIISKMLRPRHPVQLERRSGSRSRRSRLSSTIYSSRVCFPFPCGCSSILLTTYVNSH
jgi:hypothetical protein